MLLGGDQGTGFLGSLPYGFHVERFDCVKFKHTGVNTLRRKQIGGAQRAPGHRTGRRQGHIPAFAQGERLAKLQNGVSGMHGSAAARLRRK